MMVLLGAAQIGYGFSEVLDPSPGNGLCSKGKKRGENIYDDNEIVNVVGVCATEA